MDPLLFYVGYTGGHFDFNTAGAITNQAVIVDPRAGANPPAASFQPPASRPGLAFESMLRSNGSRIDRITVFFKIPVNGVGSINGIKVEYEDSNDNPYGWHQLGSNSGTSLEFPFSKGEFLHHVDGLYSMSAAPSKVTVGGNTKCVITRDTQSILAISLNRTKLYPPTSTAAGNTHFRFEAPYGYQIIGFWGGGGTAIHCLGAILKLRDGAKITGIPPLVVVGDIPVINATNPLNASDDVNSEDDV